MPNITRNKQGQGMPGLIRYLVGPGKQDEHVEPHLVAGSPSIMAWHSGTELDGAAADDIAAALDHPWRVYGTDVYGGHVWHCSLTLKAEEGELGDEKWGEIAEEFMERMGFLDEGKAPVRYAAIHHGQNVGGGDHIHLAVELVREDGTKASTWNDQIKAQAACRELEKKFGLIPVEGRAIGMGERGRKPMDVPRPARRGGPRPVVVETRDERLERIVRATAATSGTEAEFVRGLRRAGLLVRPWFANGRDDVISGFGVAHRPAKGKRPVYKGGRKLGKDLSLPRLRESCDWPDTPQDATAAAAEWKAAYRNKPVTVRSPRSAPRLDPELWARYEQEVAGLRDSLRDVPAGDVGTWAAVARQLAGAFSAWSLAAEGDDPGPLAATAATLSRSAQVPRSFSDAAASHDWAPSIRGLSLLLSSASVGGQGPIGMAVLLRQLANTAKALHDAHAAQGRAQEAQRIARVVLGDLEQVRQALPSPQLRQLAQQATVEAGPSVGSGRPAPGSPIPAHLQAHRQTHHTGGPTRGR